MKTRIGIGLTALLLSAVLAVPALAGKETTVIVSGDTSPGENQPGWMFGRDPGNVASYEFTEDNASIGDGSLHAGPISGTDASSKFIAELFMLSPIKQISSISYDFKIAGNGDENDADQFYMNVYANFGSSPADKFYDCRYDVLPQSGSTSHFTTVTFDPTEDYAVTERGDSPFDCPASPADMETIDPGATLRVFALNVGDTSLNDAGLAGYFDNVVVEETQANVVVEQAQATAIYDFEPGPAAAEDCRDGSFEDEFSNQGRCMKRVNTGKDGR